MSKLKSLEKLREIKSADGNWTFKGGKPIEQIINEIQAEVDNRFIELPVDADGVPIRVGDMLELYGKHKVYSLIYDGDYWCFSDSDGDHFNTRGWNHVNTRTLEDVLEDYVVEYQTRHARSSFGVEEFNHVDVHKMIERCAAEIRELLAGDAE